MRTCTCKPLMAEPCVVCSKVLKEGYRLRDRFGKPTQLGTVIVNLLDEALCENTPSTVRRKCRYDLLCLEKLKEEYEEVKSQLKTQLQAKRASQQLQRWQVLRLQIQGLRSNLMITMNCMRRWRVHKDNIVCPLPSLSPISAIRYYRYHTLWWTPSKQKEQIPC